MFKFFIPLDDKKEIHIPENANMSNQELQQRIDELTQQLAAAQAAGNNADASNSRKICRVNAKPPAFSKENPDLFFIQSEAQFATAGITQDATKYYYVVGNLEPRILNYVSDFIRDPPPANKYELLKERILKEFTESDMKKLRRVISECELGDNKPSQLLKRMKDLAGTKFTDDALKTFWLDRLPDSVRAVVSVIDGDSAQWAKVADKMMEVNSFSQVATLDKKTQPTQNDELFELRKENAELKAALQQRGRTENKQQDQHRARSRSKSKSKVCYYHYRFGTKANKCTKPCEFGKPSENYIVLRDRR